MSELRYYIDFKSPAAYLSLLPTRTLAEQTQTNIIYLPYNTIQKPLPKQFANESKGETHIRVRAFARQAVHKKYAKLRNIPMHFRENPGATDIALAALLFVHQQLDDNAPIIARFVEAAFKTYWTTEADLNDASIVLDLLKKTQAPYTAFDVDDYLQKLAAHQLSAEEQGVIDTPCYQLNEQIFIGREHLPWISEILDKSQPNGGGNGVD